MRCLFELNLVDFETVERGRKICVEGEGVCDVNFLALRGFCKDASFAASERLERSFDFFVF